MNFWLVQDGEPLPGIDENTRDWRTAMLARALVAQGHQVLWWASTFDHAHKRHRFDAPRTVDLYPGLSVRLLHGPGYRHNKSPQRFWHHRVLAAAYGREIADCSPPSLVYCSMPTLELAEQSVRYGCKHQVPVVVDIRDAWPDLYLNLFPAPLRRVARILLVKEFRRAEYIFESANGIIAVSDTYLTWAHQYAQRSSYNDRVFPIGYASRSMESSVGNQDINSFRQRFAIHSDGMIVAFVGTFGYSYDLETIIRAVAHINSSRPDLDIKILIAGDGDQGDKLRRMSEGIPSVIFTGWLDQNEVGQLMRISSVGLASYAKDALQSLPNKPFEYMAAGLSLLSSLTGELERLIAEYQIGLHYDAGDTHSLVEKIVWLAEHPGERIAMGQRAHKLFEERFRADIIYPRLVTHLERIVADRAKTDSVASSK